MAGPDSVGWKSRLMRIAEDLGVANQIHWPGMLRGDQKWGAFHAAKAFVLPSHQENFGLIVAEAIACGKPVLTTDKSIHGRGFKTAVPTWSPMTTWRGSPGCWSISSACRPGKASHESTPAGVFGKIRYQQNGATADQALQGTGLKILMQRRHLRGLPDLLFEKPCVPGFLELALS